MLSAADSADTPYVQASPGLLEDIRGRLLRNPAADAEGDEAATASPAKGTGVHARAGSQNAFALLEADDDSEEDDEAFT